MKSVSQRKCSNTTDLRHGGASTAVVSTGMPLTFSTGTAHLCLCTAQSWGSPHKTLWVIDFSVLPTKGGKKQASIQILWIFFHLFISRRIKKINYNWFFQCISLYPTVKINRQGEYFGHQKWANARSSLKREELIHKTYWWYDFPSNLLAEWGPGFCSPGFKICPSL